MGPTSGLACTDSRRREDDPCRSDPTPEIRCASGPRPEQSDYLPADREARCRMARCNPEAGPWDTGKTAVPRLPQLMAATAAIQWGGVGLESHWSATNLEFLRCPLDFPRFVLKIEPDAQARE